VICIPGGDSNGPLNSGGRVQAGPEHGNVSLLPVASMATNEVTVTANLHLFPVVAPDIQMQATWLTDVRFIVGAAPSQMISSFPIPTPTAIATAAQTIRTPIPTRRSRRPSRSEARSQGVLPTVAEGGSVFMTGEGEAIVFFVGTTSSLTGLI
jgi:hypothetical protein